MQPSCSHLIFDALVDLRPGYTFTALRMASRSSFFHASVRCTTMPIIFTITLSDSPFSTKKSTNALCSTTGKQISSFALPSSIVLRITQDAPCARQRYGIVPRHQNQHGVSDTRDRLLERREPPVGRHLHPRVLVVCEHVEPHVYAFSERLLRASTTSTNVYFHACDTNTVPSCASSAFVLLSISAYDILTCSVAGLTIPKHTSFVVMSSKGMSAYCTLVGFPDRHPCLRRSCAYGALQVLLW
mmetsp:Transcript_7132/g.16294  ORF Transcript_7132/g.16294 Transcript_7132/m.16294 type:complete len:243 (-) Transcript_7132:171-899(-)